MVTFPRLSWQKITLKLRNPFRISYGTSEERHAHWIRLGEDEGWGEGTIPFYYHISDESMIELWDKAAQKREPFPEEVDQVSAWVGTDGPAPARAAIDLALLDRIGRKTGKALYELLDLPGPIPAPTSFTIAIDTPEAMAQMALQVTNYPVIKVKLGSDAQDVKRIAAIRRARPDAQLRVDANAGWTLDEAIQRIAELEKYNIEMIEQPLAKDQIAGLGAVQQTTSIPIVADESVQTMRDIEALAEAGVAGINLKLMKIGGLTPALQMVKRARELGLRIMLGCMVETSIGVTAMMHLSGAAEWLDLDSPLLVTNDPFSGITYDEHAFITLPPRPGIGAVKRTEM